ncbi:hypothetical protein RZ87_02360 [Enterobacter roggenkampii]|uniref:hypothetical protein n=1 Tax=Enterobacter sp. P82 TaxID=3123033 RepID=UPI0005F97B85|nr:hypothetical protein RZ87_02360 [Enterobacter roggenkampii]
MHKKQYAFEKLPAANIPGSPVPYVLSTATEKYLSDDVVNSSKQMTYINAPDSADHGRLSSLYAAESVPKATQSFTRQHEFTYERADGVLVTTTTITGHENIATTSVSGRQLLTGLLASTTDVLGNTTDYTYDGLGRFQSKTLSAKSAYEHTTTYSYTVDENGSTITTTDPSGNQIRTGYDALERMVQKEQWNNDDLRLQGAPLCDRKPSAISMMRWDANRR